MLPNCSVSGMAQQRRDAVIGAVVSLTTLTITVILVHNMSKHACTTRDHRFLHCQCTRQTPCCLDLQGTPSFGVAMKTAYVHYTVSNRRASYGII